MTDHMELIEERWCYDKSKAGSFIQYDTLRKACRTASRLRADAYQRYTPIDIQVSYFEKCDGVIQALD